MANLSNINNKFIVTDGGNVLIGTTADVAAVRLQVKNAGAAAVLRLTGGSDSWDFDTYYTDNKLFIKSSGAAGTVMTLLGASGNVGIGTDSPDTTLDVSGTIKNYSTQSASTWIQGNGSGNNYGMDIFLTNDLGSTQGATRFRSAYGGGGTIGTAGYPNFSISRSTTTQAYNSNPNTLTYSESLVIDGSTGNIGIGTTGPSARLNISGIGQANNPTVAIDVTNSDSFNHGLEIFDGNLTTGETVLMAIGHSGSTKLTAIFGFIRNESSLDQNLATIGFWGADNKLTVAAGGNVGIGTGTAVPSEKLEVTGNVGINGFITHNGDSGTFMGWSANDTNVFYTAGNERMRISANGTVQIGASSTTNLSLGSSGSDFQLSAKKDGTDAINMVFKTQASGGTLAERMRISANGNVTIGNTASVQPLTVAGAVLFRTTTVDGFENRFQFLGGGSGDGGSFFVYNENEAPTIQIKGNGISYFVGGNVGIGVTSPSYNLSVATTLSSGSHLNANFSDLNSPTPTFVGQGGNVYDSGGIYRSTVMMAPSSGPLTTLFLSTYSSGHWGQQPTFKLVMNGTYYRGGYIEYWCQGIPGGSIKDVIAGPYGTMSDTLSVTVTRLCNTCNGGQPVDRQDWSFTTQGAYLRVSPIIITNKLGRRYFNNSSISALNALQSGSSSIAGAYFFHGISATEAAGSSELYTIT